jgi:hypothetical protein
MLARGRLQQTVGISLPRLTGIAQPGDLSDSSIQKQPNCFRKAQPNWAAAAVSGVMIPFMTSSLPRFADNLPSAD